MAIPADAEEVSVLDDGDAPSLPPPAGFPPEGRETIRLMFGDLAEPAGQEQCTTGTERVLNRILQWEISPTSNKKSNKLDRKLVQLPSGRLIRKYSYPGDYHRILRSRWGQQFEDVQATLAIIDKFPTTRLIEKKVQQWLIKAARPVSGLRAEEWRHLQMVGNLSDAYVIDFLGLASRQADENTQRKYRQRLFSLIDKPSLVMFSKPSETQESVLFVGLHAGVFGLSKHLIETRLGHGVRLGSHTKGGITSVRDDPTRALMEMVRHLKQPGNAAAIRADGNFKGATRSVDILGRCCQFGFGAPHATHFARCRNVFYLAKWQGEGIIIDMKEGPRPDKSELIDAWTERWFQAFKKYIEDLIVSDPRNIRGYGGLWSALGAERNDKAEID